MGKCQDHLGKDFNSVQEMCDYWEIPRTTYENRIKRERLSLEDALTRPKKDIRKNNCKQCQDHLGNNFNSIKEMCEFYNISVTTYKRRLKKGISVKNALIIPTINIIENQNKRCQDHLGNNFNSIKEMCEFWNITPGIYQTRFKRYKWSLEKTLTTQAKNYYPFSIICQDHLGNKFKSMIDMCKYHNTSYQLCNRRIRELHWSIEEALTIPKNMTLGEYRVRQSLDKYNIQYIHNKTIKSIFKQLNFNIVWNSFLDELQKTLAANNINWSKSKIERLRPDFVLYRDKDNKITGVVEFDGEQHFNFVEYFFKVIEEFLKRSDADFVKNSLWEYLEIPMLRIRYDQVDLIDEMVLDFITKPEKYITNHNTYLTEDEYWAELKKNLNNINNSDDLGYNPA